MAIQILVVSGGYEVVLDPPHGANWRSPEPLTATEVLATLAAMGCHSTDITDALYAADPGWAATHDAEVQRRRSGVQP